MQRTQKNHSTPRWVILIYLLSVVEAIGLSIYFSAGVTDPEMASMQPLYADRQTTAGMAAQQPACDQCLLLARSPHQGQGAVTRR
ncbi:MAG: hypothetical protein JWM30_2356 [Burkholderia sp.]|jgi:hypothetical protein|nr:hypothetical protein [Burkholderia sp.]